MGRLHGPLQSQSCELEPEHLIGRGHGCALRLSADYVSTQHAVVRWNGEAWEVLDRGSRNGTRVDGHPIEPGTPRRLHPGSALAFGQDHETWVLADAGEPQVMAIDVDSREVILARDGVIGLPSSEDPQGTILRNLGGQWKLEYAESDGVTLHNGSSFSLAGHSWRFSCPEVIGVTTGAEQQAAPGVLEFSVSSDEEFVQLAMQFPDRRVALGSRAHNYLLLILARSRLADRASGIPDTSCGWVYKEVIAEGLRMTPQQIDGEVFRVRKHFGQCGLDEAATIIQRRPRTKQLRLGVAEVRITKL